MPYLPITPQPYPEESIFSWIVRVAESNLVPSPWHLFKLVGFSEGEMKTTRIDTSRLWHLVSDDKKVLDALKYTDGEGYAFRGQPINVRDIDIKRPRICPDCVLENGYASAHWDLELTSCCHVHGRRLVDLCPACKKRLTWFRPSLLNCQCGASLVETHFLKVSHDEIALNQLLYRVAFQRQTKDDETNPAFAILAGVPLRYFLRFVTALGILSRHGHLLLDKRNRPPIEELMGAAAQVLSSWPDNFHGFLKHLLSRPIRAKQERVGVLGCINDFSSAMLEKAEDRRHGSFFRTEIRKFLAYTWDGPIDPRIVRSLMDEGLVPRWIPLRMAADQLGIDWRTLTEVMKRGLIQFRTEPTLRSNKIMVRSSDVIPDWFSPTELLGIREAAKQIGLPVSVLRELRNSGEYVQSYFGANSISFAQRDLTNLKNRILTCKHYEPSDPDHVVSLRSVMQMKFRNTSAKFEVVCAIIRGDIRTVPNTSDTLANLLLHPNDLKSVLDNITLPEDGAVPIKQAAVALHTTKQIVQRLVDSDYLCPSSDGNVKVSSIRAFMDSHICLNNLLVHRKEKIAEAEQICARKGIDLIVLTGQKTGSVRRFLPRIHIPLIKELIIERQTTSSRWAP